MSPLTNSQIDEAILAAAETSWRKVALVISRVARMLGCEPPEEDPACELIAKRIESLVQDGRLLAQGNIENWRHSEVRKPHQETV